MTYSKPAMRHLKTKYVIQFRCNYSLPGVWIDINENDFTSKDMAHWTMNKHKKDVNLGDIDYRIVQREFYYEDREV